jgi:hypothetical protein
MTRSELEALLKGLAPAIRECVDRRLDERLGTSSRAPATLEFHQVDPATLKPHVVHRGAWDVDRLYTADDAVICDGKGYRALCASKGCAPTSDRAVGYWEPL